MNEGMTYQREKWRLNAHLLYPPRVSAPEAGVPHTSRTLRSIPGVRACHVTGTGNPTQSTIVLRITIL